VSFNDKLRVDNFVLPELSCCWDGRATQHNGHYAVQGHSRSPIFVPITNLYLISY